MKRVLSLILVLVLALGSVPFAFAEETVAMKTAGETLKELKLVKGDEEGNLNEEGMLTRAEMMVMLSRLLGVEEEAMNYAIPSTSKDVEGHWAAKYIAYAEQVGKWTSGVGENMFGADQKVTTQMVAKFMLTALGHEANWDTAVADATALGLLKGVDAKATADISRADVFKASLNTIETPKKDSEVKLGITLGVLKEEVKPVAALTGEIDAVTGSGNALVQIEFKEAIDMEAAAAATYVIVQKSDAAKTIAVNKVNVESDTIVTLETDAMSSGMAYKVSVAELSAFFTGVAKETSAPKVSSVKGTDTGVVEVKFDMVMDKVTVEDIANYSINTIGTVTKAELKSDRKTVSLTVEGFTKVAAHKLTVENVLSVDAKMMSKVTRTFYPLFDKSAATIEIIKKKNNNNNKEIYVFFKDINGVDEASAEDISNYSIEGLEIISATAAKKEYTTTNADAAFSKTSSFYKRVLLVTSEQKANTKYTLKINNLVDGSTAKNVPTKEITATFYGGSADKTAPSLQDAVALTSTLISVHFSDYNDLDAATALDISNYRMDKDTLTVVDAKFKDDETDSEYVYLTVSEMDKNKSYKLFVNNVSDVFGNAMSKESGDYFQGVEVKAATVVSNVYSSGLTTVKVVFANAVTSSAKEATNYSLDGSVGAPTAAKFTTGSDTEVVLTFPELTANKTYKLTVNGVENHAGYAIDNASKSFVATRTVADFTKPSVRGVSYTNRGLLRVEFSEAMDISTGTLTIATGTTGGAAPSNTTLNAKSVTGDNDEIVVFDASTLTNATTDLGKLFKITAFSGVTDASGNNVNYTSGNDSFSVDTAVFVPTKDSVEIVGWAQDSVTEIRVFFSDVVKELADVDVTLSTRLYTAKSDSNDKAVMIFTLKDGKLAKDEVVVVDVSATVVDLADRATRLYDSSTANPVSKVTYKMFIKDTTAPSIVEAVATDTGTIVVTYDEAMSSAGSYTITVDGTTTSASGSVMSDATKVEVTAGIVLDSTKYYVIKQSTPARDLSDNYATVVTDGFEFVGSDVAPTNRTLAGVSVVNGFTVKIVDTSNLDKTANFTLGTAAATKISTSSTANVLANGSVDVLVATDTKTLELKVQKSTPFVKDVEYTITVPSVYNAAGNVVKFMGIVERGVLSQAVEGTVTGTATLSYAVVELTLSGLAALDNYDAVLAEVDTANGALTGYTLSSSSVTNDKITLFLKPTTNTKAGVEGLDDSHVIVTVLDDSTNPIRTSQAFKLQITQP